VEGIDSPLSRRGEVELVIGRLPFQRDKGFEAGVAPELASDLRQAGKRNLNPVNFPFEVETKP